MKEEGSAKRGKRSATEEAPSLPSPTGYECHICQRDNEIHDLAEKERDEGKPEAEE